MLSLFYTHNVCILIMSPFTGTFPFEWSRLQFPVNPGFALTINKAQGQTMERVGVDARDPAFSHGQLYVAASRVGSMNNIRFLIDYDAELQGFPTRNVVYKEVLQ